MRFEHIIHLVADIFGLAVDISELVVEISELVAGGHAQEEWGGALPPKRMGYTLSFLNESLTV